LTWIFFNPKWLQADVISVWHLLLLLLQWYDVTLWFLLLLLGVRGVVVSRAPARVHLHVKFFLFASHLVVLGLLGASQSVPLHAQHTSTTHHLLHANTNNYYLR